MFFSINIASPLLIYLGPFFHFQSWFRLVWSQFLPWDLGTLSSPVHRGSLPTGAQTGERFSGWLGCSKNIKKNIIYIKIVKWNLLRIGSKKMYDFFQICYITRIKNKVIFCFGFWALGCTKKTKKIKKWSYRWSEPFGTKRFKTFIFLVIFWFLLIRVAATFFFKTFFCTKKRAIFF